MTKKESAKLDRLFGYMSAEIQGHETTKINISKGIRFDSEGNMVAYADITVSCSTVTTVRNAEGG